VFTELDDQNAIEWAGTWWLSQFKAALESVPSSALDYSWCV